MINENSTQQECFDALRTEQCRLRDLNEDQKTESCCRLALCFDDQAWEAIPERFKSHSVIAEWIANGLYKETMLRALPEDFRSLDFFDALLERNPFLVSLNPELFVMGLEFFGDEYIDKVLAADKSFLAHLPEELRTEARCQAAVDQAPYLLEHVPESLITEAMCLKAVTRDACLRFVPAHLLTDPVLDAAIHCVLSAKEPLTWVPIRDEDVARIPKERFTPELCERILKSDLYAIKYLPTQMLTRTMCIDALEGKEMMGFMLNEYFAYVPEHFRGEVKSKANFIYHVQPGEFGDFEPPNLGGFDDL